MLLFSKKKTNGKLKTFFSVEALELKKKSLGGMIKLLEYLQNKNFNSLFSFLENLIIIPEKKLFEFSKKDDDEFKDSIISVKGLHASVESFQSFNGKCMIYSKNKSILQH